MKLVSYRVSGKIRLGALIDGGAFIIDLNRAHKELLATHRDVAKGQGKPKALPAAMVPFLEAGKSAMETARETLHFVERQRANRTAEVLLRKRILIPNSSATLAAPVPHPPKLSGARR
jgi:hypothetical protein